MQGSLYPDGVTVDRVALRRTEITKAVEILRNRNELSSGGILTGDPVVVNTSTSPNLRIDVPAFSGIAPNGEFIEVTSDLLNQPLSSDVANDVNIVCAVYTEVNTHNQPHESNGRVYPVRAVASYRFRIFTAAQYAALPLTDSNLANDAQDRCLVRAKVIANGGADLTPSSIAMPAVFGNFRYTVPATGAIITGVEFRNVSSGTPRGAGTLMYKYTASPESYVFNWTTTSGSPGTNVGVISDGIVSLPDGGALGESVQIEVSLATLPKVTLGDYTWTEIFQVEDLYFQDMPRFTGEDILHRSMQGSGAYSPRNPHRQTLDDLSGDSLSLLDEHQNVHHTNGIWRGSRPSVLGLSVNYAGSGDTLIVDLPAVNDLYYVNGMKKTQSNTDTGGISFDTPAVKSAYYYEVYVTDQGAFCYLQKAAFLLERNCNGCWIVNMSENYPSSPGSRLDIEVLSSSWTFSWQNGPLVTLARGIGYQTIRLYARSNERWVDLCVNTTFNSSGSDLFLPTTIGSYTDDDIVISTSWSEGNDSYMVIGGVSYWYNTASNRWVMGWNPPEAARSITDLRSWGTLGPENLSTKLYEELLYAPLSEQGRSGVLKFRTKPIQTFELASLSLTSNSIRGGVFYCRGRRVVSSQQTVTFSPSNQYLVWCDLAGTVQVDTVTGGTLQDAMKKVLGGSLDRPVVNDDYQSWDTTDVPERGVLLRYIETGATAVTLALDMMQNVNQVTNPWSVGGPLPSSGRGAPCAYDNLFSAFAYAEYHSQYLSGCPTLQIQGPVSLTTVVTQPSGCNVVGAGGLVTLDGILTERWRLSADCKVSGVTLNCTDFGPSSVVFSLENRVVIENCVASFTPDGSLCSSYRSFDAIPVGYSDVAIKGNVITGGRLLYYDNTTTLQPSTGFRMYRWYIQDNTVKGLVTSSILGPPSVIGMIQAKDSTISGNNIELMSDLRGVMAIWLYRPERAVSVINNHIYIGATNLIATAMGIYVSGSDDIDAREVSIDGNIFSRTPGSIPGQLVGVFLYGRALRVRVCNNQFEYLWCAVKLSVTTTVGMQGISVNDNVMGQIYGRPVEVRVTGDSALEAVSICRNDIQNCTWDPAPGMFTGDNFAAISVYSYYGVGSSGYVRNLNVSGNNITDMSVADILQEILGIQLSLTSSQIGAIGVQCVGNTIHNLNYTGTTNASIIQCGISVTSAGTAYVNSVNISQNVVRYSSKSKNPDSVKACGIRIKHLSFGVIDSNLVDVTSPSTDPNEWLSTGIYAEDSRNSQISNNNLDCPGSGIACVSGYGYHVSGNRIVVTGTGIYMDYTDKVLTSVEGNSVYVSVKSDAGVIKPSSISPYSGNWDSDFASYGFKGGSDLKRLKLSGNDFKVYGSSVGTDSCALHVEAEDIHLIGNTVELRATHIEGGVTPPTAEPALNACKVEFKAAVITTLNINGCTFIDSTASSGLYMGNTGGVSWDPTVGAVSGSVSGNVFNTVNTLEASPAYVVFNYEPGNVLYPNLYPYCIVGRGLGRNNLTGLGHRTLVAFTGNMINAVVDSSFLDELESQPPIAKVYLLKYTEISAHHQGFCSYVVPNLVSIINSPMDNRVTFNGVLMPYALGSDRGIGWL